MHKPLWAAAAWRNRLNWKPTAYSNLAIDWEANLGPNLWRACKVQDHFTNLLFTDPTPTWAWKPCVLTLRTVGIISGCLMEFNKNFLRNHTRGYEGEQDGGPAKNGTGTSSGKQEFMVLRLWTECQQCAKGCKYCFYFLTLPWGKVGLLLDFRRWWVMKDGWDRRNHVGTGSDVEKESRAWRRRNRDGETEKETSKTEHINNRAQLWNPRVQKKPGAENAMYHYKVVHFL